MTATTAPTAPTIDPAKRDIPFRRQVKVELRKSVDTRAGLWLLIAIGAITVIVNIIFVVAARARDRTFGNFLAASGTPQGFLLPVLGILLVTSEWSQRTAMVTFTLAPKRLNTVLAKIVAAVVLATVALIVAIAVGALMTVIGGGPHRWDVSAGRFGLFWLGQIIGVLQGVAFGLLILISAAAIVASFFIPIAFTILTSLSDSIRNVQPWIDLGTTSGYLFSDNSLSAEKWAQLGTSTAIWMVLPLLIGIWRVLRAEVK
ncbi:MAG: ABC transporter permease [Mycobacteriales bacterium]